MKRKKSKKNLLSTFIDTVLLQDIRYYIEEAQKSIAVSVNSGMTTLYWRVGKRIEEEILKGERAEYGQKVIKMLSQHLHQEYGRGFNYSSLTRMVKFIQLFPDSKIVATLSQQLSWSHFQMLITFEDDLQRDFYTEMCRFEHWSVRTLRKKMDSMLYERTALSRKPEKLIKIELKKLREQDQISPSLVFKDPYFLDFLGLKDHYLEKDLEDGILREIELFLLEMGAGFAFLARQKRITIDSEDFYLDLLFYHRKLKRLIAVDLKLGRFKAAYKSQMELYLRWLEKHETESHEEPPLGLILCTGSGQEQIELLELDQAGIHVAEYFTELPPQKLLEEKLQKALSNARSKIQSEEIQQDNTQKLEKNMIVLSSEEIRLLNLLREKKKITPNQVYKHLNLNRNQLINLIRKAKKNGWLQVHGTGRGTVYTTTDRTQ